MNQHIYFQELEEGDAPDIEFARRSERRWWITEGDAPHTNAWNFEQFANSEIEVSEWPPGEDRRVAVWRQDKSFVGVFIAGWEPRPHFTAMMETP